MKKYIRVSIPMPELGYFTSKQCEIISERMNGKTIYNFQIGWSNFANVNRTLVINAQLDADYYTYDDIDKEEIKWSFLNAVLYEFAQREIKDDF